MASKTHTLYHYLFTIGYVSVRALASSFLAIIVAIAGFLILEKRVTPWDMVIGLPMLLVGGGLFINHMTSVILSIFYPPYNRGVCIFCNR